MKYTKFYFSASDNDSTVFLSPICDFYGTNRRKFTSAFRECHRADAKMKLCPNAIRYYSRKLV